MKSAKVAHIMTVNWNVEKLLMDKIEGLKRKGYEIELISSDGEYVEKIRERGYIYHIIHISRDISLIKDLVSIYKLFKLFRSRSYDIVHTHTAKAGFVGRVAAKLAGVPIIIHTTHGLPFYEGQGYFRFNLYRWLEKIAGYACDYVFSQNQEDINKLEKYKVVDKNKIYFEGNGVNVRRIRELYNCVDPELKKKELGLEQNVFVIGYFARFEPVKGHDFFIEALAKIIHMYPNIRCIMAGRGELENDIKRKVKEKNISDNVRFLGFRDDIIEILRVTDLVVLASEKEGIPRILMESMAVGVPVVATNVLGTKELVVDQQCGLLVEYKNVSELFSAMKKMYENPQLRDRLAMNSMVRINKEFNEDIIVERIHLKYQELLKA